MAMFDYAGAEADELTFKEGDVIIQVNIVKCDVIPLSRQFQILAHCSVIYLGELYTCNFSQILAMYSQWEL